MVLTVFYAAMQLVFSHGEGTNPTAADWTIHSRCDKTANLISHTQSYCNTITCPALVASWTTLFFQSLLGRSASHQTMRGQLSHSVDSTANNRPLLQYFLLIRPPSVCQCNNQQHCRGTCNLVEHVLPARAATQQSHQPIITLPCQ